MTNMNQNQNKFAELLEQYINDKAIKPGTLAHRIGIDRELLWSWRKGRIKRPKNREAVQKCTQELQLNDMQSEEFLRAAGCQEPDSQSLTTEIPKPEGNVIEVNPKNEDNVIEAVLEQHLFK